MAKRIAASRGQSVHGWSMGFDKYKTTTSAAEWERRYAVRGLIVGGIVAAALGAYSAAVFAVGAPVALLAVATIGIGSLGGIKFYEWLERDREAAQSEGEAKHG